MVFLICTSLVSYKTPMKTSKSAHTFPCFPLCIVLLFGFPAFPVVVLIQRSTLRGVLSWRSWVLLLVGVWTRWPSEVSFNLNYSVMCMCVCMCECSLNKMRNQIIFIGKTALHRVKVGILRCGIHAQATRTAWFIWLAAISCHCCSQRLLTTLLRDWEHVPEMAKRHKTAACPSMRGGEGWHV